jgi:endonuclease/exonuclease/phosphatase family metal-dependent hydrolase
MGRPSLIFLILLAATGSWFLFNEVPTHRPGRQLASGSANGPAASGGSATPWRQPSPRPDVIRVATFNLDHFDRRKSQSAAVLQCLAAVIRGFDVVAVQEVRCLEPHVIPRLVDAINGPTADFDFAVGPHVGRYERKEQFAFIYNRRRLELHRSDLYTVQDPDDLIHSEPLVGWFRVRGVDPSAAFTFTLVNMRTDATDGETDRENSLLGRIFDSVRNDQRGEDDVVLLGDFQVPTAQLREAARMPHATFLVAETATDPGQTVQRDNIILDSQATVEFTGRCGVVDFLRQMNLTLQQAQSISNHLPVWAEFSVWEGGSVSQVAKSAADASRARR